MARHLRLIPAAVAVAVSLASPALAAGPGDGDPGIHCKPKWAALNDPGDGPVPTLYAPSGMECY